MSSPSSTDPEIAPWLQVIERKVAALRFGSVQIVVHEGRVTQIESTEKFRFNSRSPDESVAAPTDSAPDEAEGANSVERPRKS